MTMSSSVQDLFIFPNSSTIGMSYDKKTGYLTLVNGKFEFVRMQTRGNKESFRGRLILPIPPELEDRVQEHSNIAVSRGYVIVSLPWDSGFYLFQLTYGKTQPAYANRVHPQRITAVAACGNLFATGSKDCSLRVCEKDAREVTLLAFELKHRTPLKLIAINDRLNMCVSIGEDGFLLATSTANGRFLRSVELRESDPSLIAISDFGCVVVAFNRQDACLIKVLDQNLVPIGEHRIRSRILVWKYVEWGDGGEYLISALESRQLVLFKLPFVEELKLDIETESQIIGIEFICAPMVIVLTDVNGRLFFARPFSPQ
jgi:hypothetical protein